MLKMKKIKWLTMEDDYRPSHGATCLIMREEHGDHTYGIAFYNERVDQFAISYAKNFMCTSNCTIPNRAIDGYIVLDECATDNEISKRTMI